MKPPPSIEELVHAICEGTPVDWLALDASGSDTFRSQLNALKLVAGIAEVHRTPGEAGPDRAALETPLKWAHLDVLEPIASGSFGDVFRAWDPQLDREVALKLLRRAPDADAHADEVVDEGRMLARLRHPHIVSVYGAARIDGQVGLWMEYVRGRTLAQIVGDDGPLAAHKVVEVGLALCDALSAVHKAGLVHRDVKAQNVVVADDGRVVLMDFGAGREQRHAGLDMAGTPLYLAPEVARGAPATARSDIYSLGVLLRFACTGAYDDRAERWSDWPGRRLSTIIQQATARDPVARFASAAQLAESLRRAIAGPRTGRALAVAAAVLGIGAAGIWVRPFVMSPTELVRSQSDARLVLRPLWNRRPQGLGSMGKPSIDGRLLPLHDEEMRLVITDIDLENPRAPITVGEPANGLEACELGMTAIAPDNREAAFMCDLKPEGHELRVVNLDAEAPAMRRLVAGPWMPLHWPHRDYLLVEKQTPPRQLAIVDVPGGELHPVVTLPSTVDAASLTADATWVAYDTPGSGPGDHDIYAVSAEGGTPVPIAVGPHDDLLPTWAPANNAIVFISDRTGSPGLWMQPFSDGRPSGAAQALTQDLGRVADVWGLTPAGDWLYFRQTGFVRTMTVALDRAGRLVGEPAPIPTRQVGGTMMANWSPDSQRLAYQVTLTGSRTLALGVFHVATNQERIVRVPFRWFGNPRWMTDGRHVALRGRDLQDRGGVHLVDVETGASSLLVPDRVPNDELIAFQAGHANDVVAWMKSGFYRVDAASGQRRRIHEQDDAISTFAVSPRDGSLAFVKGGKGSGTLSAVGPDGRERRLVTLEEKEGFGDIKWSADGTAVVFTRARFSDKREERVPSLWRIDVDTATSEPLGLSVDGLRDLSLSPDGRALAFTEGWPAREPWILENFLPSVYRGAR
jgi:serine/threonine protein kinase/Tol biopolymer transport system component